MIQYLSAKNDLQLSVDILDREGQVIDSSLIAGLKFELFTPHTLDINRLNLTKERYIDGVLYINASELRYLAEGQLYLTTKVAFTEEHYYDGTFDVVTTSMLNYYITETDIEMTALESFRSYTLDRFDAEDASIIAIREDIARHKAENINSFNDVSVRIDELASDIHREISDLEDATSANLEALDAEIDDLSTGIHATIDDLSTNVNVTINNKIDDLSTGIHADLNDLSTNVNNTINQKIADLSSNVDSYIATHDASYNALNDNLAALDTSVKAHFDASIGALKDYIDDKDVVLNNSIQALDTSVKNYEEANDATIDDLSTRINDVSNSHVYTGSRSIDITNKVVSSNIWETHPAKGIWTKDGSEANGYGSIAIQNHSTASGEYSVAIAGGYSQGDYAISIGRATEAKAHGVALGYYLHGEPDSYIIGRFGSAQKDSSTFGSAGNTLFGVAGGTTSTTNPLKFDIRQNGDVWIQLGNASVKLQDKLNALDSSVVTKVSQLENDKGYVKVAMMSDASYQALVNGGNLDNETLYITDLHPHIPTKVSELQNDAGYLTEYQDLTGLATETYVNGKIQGVNQNLSGNYYTKTQVDSSFALKSELVTAYDDTSVRAEIADVSTYAHSVDAKFADYPTRQEIIDDDDMKVNMLNSQCAQFYHSKFGLERDSSGGINYDFEIWAENVDRPSRYLNPLTWEAPASGRAREIVLALDVSAFATSTEVTQAISDVSNYVKSTYATKEANNANQSYALRIGGQVDDVSTRLADVSTYAHSITIPTNISAFNNDVSYIPYSTYSAKVSELEGLIADLSTAIAALTSQVETNTSRLEFPVYQ